MKAFEGLGYAEFWGWELEERRRFRGGVGGGGDGEEGGGGGGGGGSGVHVSWCREREGRNQPKATEGQTNYARILIINVYIVQHNIIILCPGFR